MEKLELRLYEKMRDAIKCTGTFEPDENLSFFEEDLTIHEYNILHGFLSWCHKTGTTFGNQNYNEIYNNFVQLHI